mmetsp:Transcript_23938/g.55092  ORF Transcript_23938/g.55092 Transcript_23938/m.55092 type:complete len:340 (-) Transcript_23938:723-1742(-)
MRIVHHSPVPVQLLGHLLPQPLLHLLVFDPNFRHDIHNLLGRLRRRGIVRVVLARRNGGGEDVLVRHEAPPWSHLLHEHGSRGTRVTLGSGVDGGRVRHHAGLKPRNLHLGEKIDRTAVVADTRARRDGDVVGDRVQGDAIFAHERKHLVRRFEIAHALRRVQHSVVGLPLRLETLGTHLVEELHRGLRVLRTRARRDHGVVRLHWPWLRQARQQRAGQAPLTRIRDGLGGVNEHLGRVRMDRTLEVHLAEQRLDGVDVLHAHRRGHGILVVRDRGRARDAQQLEARQRLLVAARAHQHLQKSAVQVVVWLDARLAHLVHDVPSTRLNRFLLPRRRADA